MRSVADFVHRGRKIADTLLSSTAWSLLVASTIGLCAGVTYSLCSSPSYISNSIISTPPAVPVESLLTDRHAGYDEHLSRDSISVRVAIELLESIADDNHPIPVLKADNPLDLTPGLVARRVRENLKIRKVDKVIFLSYRSTSPDEAHRIVTLSSQAFLEMTSEVDLDDVDGDMTYAESMAGHRALWSGVRKGRGSGSLDSLATLSGTRIGDLDATADRTVSSLTNNPARQNSDSRYAVVQKATLPLTPVNRPLYFNVLASLLLFGLIGVGASVTFQKYQPYVRSTVDVRSEHIRSTGSVDELKKRLPRKSQRRSSVWEMYPTSRASSHPLASVVEALNGNTTSPKLMVTSPTRRAGATTVSWNLALLYARLGRSTLLVEVDRNAGSVSEPTDRPAGLLEVLWGTASPSQTIFQTSRSNLSVLPAGNVPEGVIPVRSEWERLVSFLERRYDTIVVDVHAGVSDEERKIYADWASKVVMVARANRTNKKDISRYLHSLEAAETYLVVNRVSAGQKGANAESANWYLAVANEGSRQGEDSRVERFDDGMDHNRPDSDGNGVDAGMDIHERLDALLAPYRPKKGSEQRNRPVSL